MNKAKFFKYCHAHETTSGVQLSVSSRREYRGLDNVLYLHGCWHNSTILEVELYRPLPGRQGQGVNPYKVANERLAAAEKKFQRWLDEFFDAQQFVKQLREGVRKMREKDAETGSRTTGKARTANRRRDRAS